MSFEVPTTGQKLDFKGTAYEGLEITVDEAPLGLLTGIMKGYKSLSGDDLDLAAAADVLEQLTGQFGELLEDWNVTRKGVPVPATAEGLRSFGMQFAMDIIGAWLTGSAAAPPGLGKDSASGETSPEEQAAMAALSKSLPS